MEILCHWIRHSCLEICPAFANSKVHFCEQKCSLLRLFPVLFPLLQTTKLNTFPQDWHFCTVISTLDFTHYWHSCFAVQSGNFLYLTSATKRSSPIQHTFLVHCQLPSDSLTELHWSKNQNVSKRCARDQMLFAWIQKWRFQSVTLVIFRPFHENPATAHGHASDKFDTSAPVSYMHVLQHIRRAKDSDSARSVEFNFYGFSKLLTV